MILETDQEYERTLQMIHDLEQRLPPLPVSSGGNGDSEAWIREAQIEASYSMLDTFRMQVADYEQLKSGKCRRFEFHSVTELFTALIKARIAAGISQAELAEALGIEEVQLRRYEDKEYQTAPLGVISDAADLLGVNIMGSVELTNSTGFAEAKRDDAELGFVPAPELVTAE